MSFLVLSLLWIAFCTLHSALISVSFKGWALRRMGAAGGWFRLGYNLIAHLTFLPVAAYARSLHGNPFFTWTGWLLAVKFALLTLAVLGFVFGARGYDMAQFTGWAQAREGQSHGLLSRTGTLSGQGILGMVRHPWYASVFPLLWSRDLDASTLVTNTVLCGYVVIGTFLEERKLVLEFGEAYRDYQRRVSMLFPWKWIKAKVRMI